MSIKASGLLLLVLLRAVGYSVLISGWASLRRFSKLGIGRSVLQRLAYEAAFVRSFIFIFIIQMRPILNTESYSLNVLFPIIVFFILIIDCNRAPFDLLEGERELIRGYNTEMRRISFVFLFLGEYGLLLRLTIIVSSLLLQLNCSVVLLGLILLSRRSFPRIRYDVLMDFIWKQGLPLSLTLMTLSFFSM